MSKPKVVFFGSGPVALASLQLLRDNLELEAIITKPATLHDMQQAFPGTPTYAVSTRVELDTLCQQQAFTSPCGLLIDFGIIVSQKVIDSFPKGIINSHFSLLPQWRGADPITFAILSGQAETGVSLMLLVPAMDEGPLLAQAHHAIAPDATTPSLTSELVALSADLLKQHLPAYIAGTLQPTDQTNDPPVSYSRKLTKEDGKLDWTKPATALERQVRAFLTWPNSYTTLAGRDIIVTGAHVHDLNGTPGTIVANKHHLYICCGEQALEIVRLKPAGKTEMPAEAFLAGYRSQL